jgi:hypothetical protein
MTYNENSKIAIMKWRSNNKEMYNSYMTGQMKIYHSNNKEKVNGRRMERYYASKVFKDPFLMEAKIFRYILL